MLAVVLQLTCCLIIYVPLAGQQVHFVRSANSSCWLRHFAELAKGSAIHSAALLSFGRCTCPATQKGLSLSLLERAVLTLKSWCCSIEREGEAPLPDTLAHIQTVQSQFSTQTVWALLPLNCELWRWTVSWPVSWTVRWTVSSHYGLIVPAHANVSQAEAYVTCP